MATEENGADRLMDHEYDGIREYDNPLPAWWVYIFWATILFCVPYWLYYQTAAGHTIIDEYEAEVAAHQKNFMDRFGELTPDRETIAKYMKDKDAMRSMQALFQTRCAPCHKPDGSGLIGPNLTDDRWIHVKDLPDIYTVVSNGVPGKGMVAWKGILSDTELVLISAYVATLREHPVPGKAPEGDAVPPWAAE